MNPEQTMALQEAFRRRAGQQPSSAGMGAPVANSPSAQNPLAQSAPQGQAPQLGGQPAPGGGTTTGATKQADPFTAMAIAGIKQLGESAPGETELFLKALIQRLRTLGGTPAV